MTKEECMKIFPDLNIENDHISYPKECVTPASRLAYFLNLHREALGKNEYSKCSPQSILKVEPFKSLLPSTDSTESVDVLVSMIAEIRKRLYVKGDTKSKVFLSQLNSVTRYVHMIAISERVSFINAYPERNMTSILSPIYSADNPEYQWGVNLKAISKDIESIRDSAIELLEQLKNLNIDEELKAYLYTSLLSIIKALEHYQLCGIDDVESVIARTMLRYHKILSDMQKNEDKNVKDFSNKIVSLSQDIYNAVKKTVTRSLIGMGIYNEITEFAKNLLEG